LAGLLAGRPGARRSVVLEAQSNDVAPDSSYPRSLATASSSSTAPAVLWSKEVAPPPAASPASAAQGATNGEESGRTRASPAEVLALRGVAKAALRLLLRDQAEARQAAGHRAERRAAVERGQAPVRFGSPRLIRPGEVVTRSAQGKPAMMLPRWESLDFFSAAAFPTANLRLPPFADLTGEPALCCVLCGRSAGGGEAVLALPCAHVFCHRCFEDFLRKRWAALQSLEDTPAEKEHTIPCPICFKVLQRQDVHTLTYAELVVLCRRTAEGRSLTALEMKTALLKPMTPIGTVDPSTPVGCAASDAAAKRLADFEALLSQADQAAASTTTASAPDGATPPGQEGEAEHVQALLLKRRLERRRSGGVQGEAVRTAEDIDLLSWTPAVALAGATHAEQGHHHMIAAPAPSREMVVRPRRQTSSAVVAPAPPSATVVAVASSAPRTPVKTTGLGSHGGGVVGLPPAAGVTGVPPMPTGAPAAPNPPGPSSALTPVLPGRLAAAVPPPSTTMQGGSKGLVVATAGGATMVASPTVAGRPNASPTSPGMAAAPNTRNTLPGKSNSVRTTSGTLVVALAGTTSGGSSAPPPGIGSAPTGLGGAAESLTRRTPPTVTRRMSSTELPQKAAMNAQGGGTPQAVSRPREAVGGAPVQPATGPPQVIVLQRGQPRPQVLRAAPVAAQAAAPVAAQAKAAAAAGTPPGTPIISGLGERSSI